MTSSSDLTVSVVSKGENGWKYSGDIMIPETVSYNGKPYRVTEIGSQTFYKCSNVTSVTIPNSVTYIGGGAFNGCTGHLFVDCNTREVDAGASGAFYHSKFSEVVYSDNVTIIGGCDFYECEDLKSLTFGKNITRIGTHAFFKCKALTSVTIPNSVTIIENSAFSGCKGLTSVTIPDNVTSIEYAAFNECSELVTVAIPNSVTSIGTFAFRSLVSDKNQLKSYQQVFSIGNYHFVAMLT